MQKEWEVMWAGRFCFETTIYLSRSRFHQLLVELLEPAGDGGARSELCSCGNMHVTLAVQKTDVNVYRRGLPPPGHCSSKISILNLFSFTFAFSLYQAAWSDHTCAMGQHRCVAHPSSL